MASNSESSNDHHNMYVLSQTLHGDGSPIRSLTTIPPSPPTSSYSSTDFTTGYQLVSGSGDGLLSSHTLEVISAYGVARTSIQPGGAEGGGGVAGRHPHQIGVLLSIPYGSSTASAASGSASAAAANDSGGAAGFGKAMEGGYITGCRDGIIRIFGPDHGPIRELNGHTNQVTSLAWLELSSSSSGSGSGGGSGGPLLLVSGSWDGTARLWNVATGTCVATLDNHENGVSVVGLPPPPPAVPIGNDGGATTIAESPSSLRGRLATTSAGVAANNTIRNHRVRLWDIVLPTPSSPVASSVICRRTVSNDHDGPIRAVDYDPETHVIVTASNDGTVKVRDGDTAECIATLTHPAMVRGVGGGGQQQQPPLLLDVAVLGGGKYAATAEDGTVVIWSSTHGSGTTAGSSAAEAAAVTEPQVLEQPGSVWTIIPLPNGDVATGCQDGTVRIYTLSDDRKANADDIAALADVVAATRTKTSGGPSAEEIAALPKWELAALNQGRSDQQIQMFNKGGIAIAAQWSATSGTWIEVGEVTCTNENEGEIDGVSYDHEFPIKIDAVGGGVRTLRIGYNNGENPFVVAQKFIDDNELPQYHLAEIADYIRQRAGEAGPTLGMDAGGAAAAPPASASSGPVPMDIVPPTSQQYSHLPIRGYKTFETGASEQSLSKIVAKAREFNSTLTTNLTSAEIGPTLDSLCQTLAATNRYHATKVSDAELAAVGKMVRYWDAERCFPALDLARLVAVHPDAASSTREAFWTELVAAALEKCEAGVSGTAAVAVPMLTMRLCANCFKGGAGSLKAVTGQLVSVLKCGENLANSSNKNVRLAVSTVVLNAASYGMSSGGLDAASSEQILAVVGAIVGSGLYETEGVVRALVAMGTALLIPGGGGVAAKEKAKALHIILNQW